MKCSPPVRPSCYRLIGGVFLAAMATGLPTAAAQSPAEWNSQYAELENNLRNRAHFQQVAPTTYRREALILDEDRDPADMVLRRTAALLEHLRQAASTTAAAVAGRGTRSSCRTPARTSIRRTARRGTSCLTTRAGCVG